MIELYAQPKKNIFESTTTSTKTDAEFLYFNNNEYTDIDTTYLEYNAIKLHGSGKIYLNDIFEESGEYEITFKIHHITNSNVTYIRDAPGGLFIKAVNVNGTSYDQAPLGVNSFPFGDFPTDGQYTITINSPGNNKDLLFSVYGLINSAYADVIIYDINITAIKPWLKLGVDEKANMVLSNSLKDVREPDKIKSLYSQTFLLPSTEINQEFFGHLNHNDTNPDFNINLLQKSFLVVDGIDIGLGSLELKNIETTSTGSKYFNIIYKSDTIDVFTNIKEKKLMNLVTDFSIDTSISNIESLVSAYDNGKELVEANQDYSFGIMNRGKQMETGDYMNTFSYNSQEIANTKGLLGKDMIPVIPVKTILTNIFNNEGYTIDGSLFDDDIFKSLVVPLYSPIITDDTNEYDDKIETPVFVWNNIHQHINRGGDIDGDFAILGDWYRNIYPYSTGFTNMDYGKIPTTLFKSRGVYQRSPNSTDWLYKFTPKKDQRTNIRISGEIEVIGEPYTYYSGIFPFISNFYNKYELDLYIVYPSGVDGGDVFEEKIDSWNSNLEWETDIDLVDKTYIGAGTNTIEIDFLVPSIYLYKINTFDSAPFFKFKIKKIDTIRDDVIVKDVNSKIDFVWNFKLQLNSVEENIEFVYPDTLQEPMKYLGDSYINQMDFVKSLSNMFNLYIDVDKNNKIINFDVHDDFYDDTSYDLTEKIILDKKIDKKFLSSITPRINNFNFSEYNTINKDKYFNDFDERPGDLEYVIDNETSIKTSTYDNSSIFIFSKDKQMRIDSGSTDSVSFNMAEILRYEEGVEIIKNEYNIPFNFMFLNKATTASNMTIRDIELNTESIKPIIISNRNDVDNKFHLTYKTPKRVYTDINYNYDNFFTDYWKDYLSLFNDKNSYMLVADFWLSTLDFVNLKMSKLVRIQNELYFINKIKNWSPLKPTKMELYKLNKRDIGNNEPTEYIPREEIPSGSDSININTDINGVENTIIDLINGSVNGDANTISNSSNLIVINDNNSIMSTSDSTISGENNIVNNSTNITMTSCEGVTLTNCSNLIITDEIGTSYINNVKVETGQQTNIMTTGGLNVTQEPFTDAGIIDSGEDEIYEPDWIDSMKKQDGNQ